MSKLTEEQKKEVIIIKELVDEITNDCHKNILLRLKDRDQTQKFLMYGRIVLNLFSVHFGATINEAEKSHDKFVSEMALK